MTKSFLADSVAAEMSDIMESDSHKSTFAPVIKTAAAKKKEDKEAIKKKKEKEKAKIDKNKADDKKKKDKAKADKEKMKALRMKKKADLIEACMSLSKISEILDSYGLEKSAHVVLGSASLLVSEASFDVEDDCDADDKDDEDKADADDAEIEVSDADDCSPTADENDASDSDEDENKADDKDEDEEKKADSHSAEDVSGEKLRALLTELGLGNLEDEEHAIEDKKELDEEYADDYDDCYSMPKEAEYRALISKVAAEKSKPKSEFIFPKDHKKVTDNKDHFPVNSESRARNALAQASKFKKAPPWFKGTLEDLVATVQKAVKKKYKNIEVTDKSKKPGKG